MADITLIDGATDKIKDSDTIINTNFTNLNNELAEKQSFVWNEVVANPTTAVNTGYVASGGTLITVALPSTSAVGDVIGVVGKGSGGWKISQGAGQQIFFGNQSTTSGATGYLASSTTGDIIHLICIDANLTWRVLYAIGNITIN